MQEKELHTSDGLVLHYIIHEGRGPYAVFIHGSGGNASVWEQYAFHFQDTGFVMLDLRGHGKSTLDAEWNFQAVVDDVYKILDQEKIQNAVVVGNCLGATLAVELARRYPAAVKKLVLISLFGSKYIRFSSLLSPFASLASAVSPKTKGSGYIDYQLHSEKISWTMPLLDLKGTGWHCYFSSIRDLFRYPLDVGKIRKAALIIQGRKDPFARNTRIFRDAERKKKLVLVDTDHLVALRMPERVSMLIRDFAYG